MKTQKMRWKPHPKYPNSFLMPQKMLRLLHGFETNFGNIESVLRRNSSYSPRKKPRVAHQVWGYYVARWYLCCG
jgi:hypothetical protein